MKWTEKQQQVIDSRNRNLLVSAAAGSGKTAVLVERIISMISEGTHPLNIDQLLVMTFTNAAASSTVYNFSLSTFSAAAKYFLPYFLAMVAIPPCKCGQTVIDLPLDHA